jgi:DNA-binding GntR family transcriptional regulator
LKSRGKRQTADKAIATLRSEGLVRTEGRAGTVVQEKEARGEVAIAVEIDGQFEVTSTDVVTASGAVARELRVNEGSSVVVVRLRHISGQPD